MAPWTFISKVLMTAFCGAMFVIIYRLLANKTNPNIQVNIIDDLLRPNENKLKSDDPNSFQIANSTVPNIPTNIMDNMLQLNEKQVEHDDPRLIQFIQDYFILPPSTEQYNLQDPNRKDYTSKDKDFVLPNTLRNFAGKGFFVECGAHDGEYYSHSLYFEKTEQWNGLLIEANPQLFKQLRQKHRKAYTLNACLSTKTYPSVMTFNQLNNIGKLVEGTFKEAYKTHYFKLHRNMIQLQCFPLYSILLALNRVQVDLFILDVEGSELEILRTIPWDRVNIKYIVVEFEHVEGGQTALKDYLKDKGYVDMRRMNIDLIFGKI